MDKQILAEFNELKSKHPIYGSELYTIYGPYQRKDLRRHIVIYDGKSRKTISYPRFIMECRLGKVLEYNEEVHHKNQIEFDDRLENFIIVNESDHGFLHSKINYQNFTCPVCNTIFTLTPNQVSRRNTELKRKPNMKGPYCSRSCSGKVNN